MHLHARRHVVVGAEGVRIHETDHDEIRAGREQHAGREGEVNALGELHAREIKRHAAAGVLQFHVLVAARRGIEHDLGDAEKILQIRDVVRRPDHELLRQRPLAVAARGIGVQDTRAIAAADAHDIGGQGDVRVEGGNGAALPVRFDFIFLRLGRAVNRSVRARDFRHAPAQRLERAAAAVGRRVERKPVDREARRARITDRRAVRLRGIRRHRVEREGRVRRAIADVVLHHLRRAAEVVARARLVLPLVEVIVAGLAQIDDGRVEHHRVVIPHRAIRIHDGRRVRAARHPPILVNEPERLVGIEEQIAKFAHTIAELRADGGEGSGAGKIIQHAALERLVAALLAADIHVVRPGQVEIPRQHRPQSRHRVLVVEIVFAIGDVVLMDAL